ncbi:hypothetical protein HMI54_008560 [Coelomomyces lativittatus]|nr:hypothetical protein HMI56_007372 [Coelomomyces lativittatus]KAJ1515755.1 hypothetical protein HMI55_003371 [Coelomomyces lativittatus]KAJ1516670.1 hypothetical protein HMI54_008560 [Coelomomyces lativittatus]
MTDSTLLDFSGKGLKLNTAEDVKDIVSQLNGMPELTEIRLSGSTFGVEAIKAIAKGLEGKKHLKICQFSDIFISRLRSEIPESIRCLTAPLMDLPIHVLDLSDNAFGPDGAEPLYAFLSKNTTLHTLVLNNNGLGIDGGQWIAKALIANAENHPDRIHPFQRFSAGRNRLESDSMQLLAKAFSMHPNLTHLSIPQNGIRPNGIVSLMQSLQKCVHLQHLDFQDNTFMFLGANALASNLKYWPSLVSLHVGDCLLTDQGGSVLLKALQQPLSHLYLGYNELSHKSIRGLVRWVQACGSQLELLEINGNAMDPESEIVDQLREALHFHKREHVLDELDDMDYDPEECDIDEDDLEEEDVENEKEEKEEKLKIEKETKKLEDALEKLSF